ncbi:MAG: cysW, partial [Massilia sp.]|nr:cysW [Massilia sp.]
MSAVLDTPVTVAAPRRGELPTASNVFEPPWVRIALIVVALAFLTLFLFVPLVAVFAEAFKKGGQAYL